MLSSISISTILDIYIYISPWIIWISLGYIMLYPYMISHYPITSPYTMDNGIYYIFSLYDITIWYPIIPLHITISLLLLLWITERSKIQGSCPSNRRAADWINGTAHLVAWSGNSIACAEKKNHPNMENSHFLHVELEETSPSCHWMKFP